MGRVIITIDEIVAGRGLRSNKESVPPALEVYCGNGLQYGDNDDLTLSLGAGLAFNADGQLVVTNEEVAGNGLVPGPGSQLDVDTTPDPDMEQSFRVVTDAKFQMDGYRLVFATTYTNMIVHRSHAGVVLGVEPGDSVVELQPLNIDGYGYGNAPTPVPAVSKTGPSFYKQ